MKYKLRSKKNFGVLLWFTLLITQVSCKKLVEIKPPDSSITTEQVFADSSDANSAMLGIYSNLINAGNFASGFETIYCGMSADELLPFLSSADQFSKNILNQGNNQVNNAWTQAYQFLYQANASIEGLNSSTGITSSAKNHLQGELRFIRALIYFYLVNLFSDVPYITGSDYRVNSLAARMPEQQVYDSIVNDLKFAKSVLDVDYSYYDGGERVRANRFAATALLARVYLYRGNWSEAENEATDVIASGIYSINNGLDQVFQPNNTEAILQWRQNVKVSFNANLEGITFIPYDNTSPALYYLTPQLLGSFEENDQRRVNWVDSTDFSGTIYYYPYKYKVGPAQQGPNIPATEYYTILRLAEQYLIRAEARAHLNSNLNGAIEDINVIRERAGLSPLSSSLNGEEILAAVAQERRIEFFAEWGHRWLDLKRTGQVDAVLQPLKPLWQSYQQLYPIPLSEIRVDPNLIQNPGYH